MVPVPEGLFTGAAGGVAIPAAGVGAGAGGVAMAEAGVVPPHRRRMQPVHTKNLAQPRNSLSLAILALLRGIEGTKLCVTGVGSRTIKLIDFHILYQPLASGNSKDSRFWEGVKDFKVHPNWLSTLSCNCWVEM